MGLGVIFEEVYLALALDPGLFLRSGPSACSRLALVERFPPRVVARGPLHNL